MCKPVLPIVKDTVAHILWKAEHLAAVHQHNGNEHVHHEIAKATNEDENSQMPGTSKPADPVAAHIAWQSYFSLSPLELQKEKYGTKTFMFSSLSLNKLYPPPKSC